MLFLCDLCALQGELRAREGALGYKVNCRSEYKVILNSRKVNCGRQEKVLWRRRPPGGEGPLEEKVPGGEGALGHLLSVRYAD